MNPQTNGGVTPEESGKEREESENGGRPSASKDSYQPSATRGERSSEALNNGAEPPVDEADADATAKKPVSHKKLDANRRNAKKSTGPKTGEGKRKSRMNALKHGLLAKEVVVNIGEVAEEQAEFDALLAELRDGFGPEGGMEEFVVQKIAACCWKEIRGARYESTLMSKYGFSIGDSLRTMLRYQTANSRELYRAIGLLERLQNRPRPEEDVVLNA